MKTRPTPRKCGRIAVLLVLTPMMMLNASQAMTLCVGHDGHIAIELLVGDQCTCELRTAGADHVLIDAASRLADGRSLSCSDFVVPIGACGVRAAPATFTVISGVPEAVPLVLLPASIDAIDAVLPMSPPACSCHHTPPRGVILRV